MAQIGIGTTPRGRFEANKQQELQHLLRDPRKIGTTCQRFVDHHTKPILKEDSKTGKRNEGIMQKQTSDFRNQQQKQAKIQLAKRSVPFDRPPVNPHSAPTREEFERLSTEVESLKITVEKLERNQKTRRRALLNIPSSETINNQRQTATNTAVFTPKVSIYVPSEVGNIVPTRYSCRIPNCKTRNNSGKGFKTNKTMEKHLVTIHEFSKDDIKAAFNRPSVKEEPSNSSPNLSESSSSGNGTSDDCSTSDTEEEECSLSDRLKAREKYKKAVEASRKSKKKIDF